MKFVDAVGPGQIREFDADGRVLVFLRVAAEAFEPALFWHISSAQTCTIFFGTVKAPQSAVR